MKRIYLVRHCKATGQAPDAELTTEGALQSAALAKFFLDKNIELIVSSPFERALATIRPLSEQTGLQIHIDDRFRERVLSSLELADWMEKVKESFEHLQVKLPGGESAQEAMDRGGDVVKELFRRNEDNVVAVTHGNLMSLIVKQFNESFGFETWQALSNPDVYELCSVDGAGEVQIKRVWNP